MEGEGAVPGVNSRQMRAKYILRHKKNTTFLSMRRLLAINTCVSRSASQARTLRDAPLFPCFKPIASNRGQGRGVKQA